MKYKNNSSLFFSTLWKIIVGGFVTQLIKNSGLMPSFLHFREGLIRKTNSIREMGECQK